MNAKEFVAIKLQSQFKRKKAQKLLIKLRKQRAALIIQKFIKGKKSYDEGRRMLYKMVMIKRL